MGTSSINPYMVDVPINHVFYTAGWYLRTSGLTKHLSMINILTKRDGDFIDKKSEFTNQRKARPGRDPGVVRWELQQAAFYWGVPAGSTS